MYLGYSLSLVIPCLNEEEAIKHVLSITPSFFDEIIVVDNNSQDNTAKIAKQMGARVVVEKKRGYGAALQRGIYAAKKQLICTLDGDGTYDPRSFKELIKHLHRNKLHFVCGNRFNGQHKNTMHRINHLGNVALTTATNLLYNKRILDSQSGMMVLKKEILPKIVLTQTGMSFSEEIKLEVISKKFKFGEFPIAYRGKQRIGKKKLRLWEDGFQNLLFLVVKRLSTLRNHS